ncbi:HlyD family secretion protein [Lichenicola sp.]|uniref:HlyD family secretion protein n=1 Tax=Lichenicola sp. TaxID=2804529 RepID=UPI003B004396
MADDAPKFRSDKPGSDKDDKPADPPPPPPPPAPPAKWPWVVAGLIVVGFVAVVLVQILVPKPDVWTDDAYVTVHYATVAPRVSGQVNGVMVDDNQLVHAGQVLATLDPRDFQTSVAQAEAAVARDTAQVTNASANVARQPPLIEEQQASVASAEARLAFSKADARRYGNLAATGAGTTQQRQQADTTTAENQASLDSAKAALEASRRQMQVLQAQQASSEGTVKADRAQLEQARLNLSYATITAPFDGMVGNRSVQVGNYVGPGAVLMTVVPLDRVYIEANYRELALRHVRSGQHVTIHVDAYDIDLDGIVDSVPPASGAAFAPIAPNNATGNFTKIVQRLPVKIVLSPNQPLAKLLRVGFSVETTIHTGLENVVADQENSPNRITVH